MSDKIQSALELHKKITSIASGVALGFIGSSAFTTTLPVLTGALVGTALLSSGVAAYSYYKSLEDENEKAVNGPISHR